MERDLVRLDLAVQFAPVVLQPAARRLEGIADRNIDILVGVLVFRMPVHDQLLAGHAQLDAHVEQLALAVPTLGRFDYDPAAGQMVEVLLQLFGLLAHPRLDRLGAVHVAETDLQWNVHWRSLLFSP